MTRPDDRIIGREHIRRDQNLALGCAFAVALLVAIALIVYLWTL